MSISKRKRSFYCLKLLIIFLSYVPSFAYAMPPNILLIVADDLGYSDIGCYGGEIETPALDKLSEQGIRFTGFKVNPMCVVTRTSLITGHTHSQSDEYRASLPFPKLLKRAGYATSISGKWHQPGNPLDAGFDSFYGFLHGAINSWTGQSAGADQIQRNKNQPAPVPEGWYATDAFTDDAITQIDSALKQEKPFFAYVAYNAPHTPLHAYREDVEKYYDRYEAGWKTLREERFKRLREEGLINRRYVDSPPNAEVRRWDEMPLKVQKQEARRMAAYAGMVDRMDQNIGRLLDHLDKRGVSRDTLVIFFSDNGGAFGNGNIATYDAQIPWEKDSDPFASNGWSYLRNTPFRWYKSSAESGGVASPMIVRWPNGIFATKGSILRQRLHVTDWHPTFLELAGIRYPDTDEGRELKPLYGSSILPLFRNPLVSKYAIHDEIFWAYSYIGKGLVSGDWKISSISDGPWRLYNVKEDPTTVKDLAAERPDKLKELDERWFDFAENHTAMPLSWRRPLKDYQEGWGYHRIRMIMPSYVSATPHMAEDNVPLDTDLTFNFSEPISFSQSTGKRIRLYAVNDPDTIVWQADPEPGHPAEGTQSISFDLPVLLPDTTYYALSDPGWITLGDHPAGGLNDGAYWFRFRTGSETLDSEGSGTMQDIKEDLATGILPDSPESGRRQNLSESPPFMENPAAHWVATDALGRALPQHETVGDLRENKWVGMFYYIWVGNHNRTVYDISKIIEDPVGRRDWGPENSFHFWGEPEYGYYHASDPWVIRHDMQMLANAGVDFIHFDTTNALLYLDTVKAVCEVIMQMRAEGLNAPYITFTTNSKSGQTMNAVYDEFYSKNFFPETWFYWQGKPLMLGHTNDPDLRQDVRDFFTIKRSWVAPGKPAKDHWNWLAFHPQSYGYSDSQSIPEHVSVSAAFHPANPRGKSFHQGKQPPVDENYLTPLTPYGPHLEEQFVRAREIDPKVITITQWNEWLAQRFIFGKGNGGPKNKTYAGRPIAAGESYFVDVWNSEFTRDIAPMKGGYTDNYYYHIVDHIRRFKGMPAPVPRPEMQTMFIDAEFSDWASIPSNYWDPTGDTRHRDYEGTDPRTRYINKTGRNDIIAAKAVHDATNVYFYVKTKEPLTPHNDKAWMLLFIDLDQNKATGWEGYDLLINRHGATETSAHFEAWGAGGWESLGRVKSAYAGNELELSVPSHYFRGAKNGFDFKWADNPSHLDDASAFFLDGDAAPDRRFNYRY